MLCSLGQSKVRPFIRTFLLSLRLIRFDAKTEHKALDFCETRDIDASLSSPRQLIMYQGTCVSVRWRPVPHYDRKVKSKSTTSLCFGKIQTSLTSLSFSIPTRYNAAPWSQYLRFYRRSARKHVDIRTAVSYWLKPPKKGAILVMLQTNTQNVTMLWSCKKGR